MMMTHRQPASISEYNVIWDLPSADCKGSMPIGNGDIGANVRGEDMAVKSPTTQQSTAPGKNLDVSVFPLTAQTPSADDWIKRVERQAAAYGMNAPESVWDAHQKWWHQFWDRSWIFIESKPGDDGFVVTRGYALQSWMTACAGRGHMPIKFNGSLFTVDGIFKSKDTGPDYRRWGPNFDWTPDQTHGGVNMIALQQMLIQTEPASPKIHLFPAWPKDWDCSFQLHAPGQTIVQGKVKSGTVVDLVVTPEARRKDIVIDL